MRLRWVFVPLAVFAVAAIVPTVIGSTSGPGRGGAEGVPGWAFAAYAVAGLALYLLLVVGFLRRLLSCTWSSWMRSSAS
jgi:hypothetical protein